jgi:glycosyltransferase involved in cell wall biosynthesis
MRVGMLSADWGDYQTSSPGGCTWIRFFMPAEKMMEQGIEVFIGEFGWDDKEGFVVAPTSARLFSNHRGPIKNNPNSIKGLDVVIFKLWMWHEANEYIEKAKKLGQTVIIDIDDWFHGLPTTNIAFQTTHPDKDAKWNRNHMLGTYRNVTGLITSTKFLYDYYSKSNSNCELVRNSLNPKYFVKRYDAARNNPTIGWVGIMIWRSGDIETLKGWLGPVLDKYDLRFHHAGVDPNKPTEFAEIAGINPDRLSGTTGCSPHYYGNILLPMDIAIVPLNTLPFNEAKSSLKGMEYAFSGIPFIAADTYEYRLLSEQGAGNVASRPKDWMKVVQKLIDPDERKRQADRGYNTVMEHYNIDTKVHDWIKAIEKIHATNPKRRNG